MPHKGELSDKLFQHVKAGNGIAGKVEHQAVPGKGMLFPKL